ncbi:hypothetical protein D9O36_09935 [Zobellia amurskyensis]|uniref:Uncharacterized protein n=1 Tax=Zobellia amurskyensis TaxID=248905 RepID=A0A7X2ZTK3_9FLAO|nr:hypothetical protein [Zobellia amurskyensis]MUH36162.1 hypothetical protein [Zobellia amurskyensis]
MDLFELLLEGKKINDFWERYNDFCENPVIKNINSFYKALPILVERLEGDFSSSKLSGIIKSLSIKDFDFGKELYFKIINEECLTLYPQIKYLLSGLYESNSGFVTSQITQLITGNDNQLREVGIDSASEIDISRNNISEEFKDCLNNSLLILAKDKNERKLWPAVFRISRNQLKTIDNAYSIIDILVSKRDIDIQKEIINLLLYNLDIETDLKLIKKYLQHLIRLDLKHKGEYHSLSYFLKSLVEKNLEVVIKFINCWVVDNVANSRNIAYFSQTLNSIYDVNFVAFQKLYTSWMNHDKVNFQIALHNMNNGHEFRDYSDLEFSLELLMSYTKYDIEFISYKTLGYIYDRELTQSLLYSILVSKYKDCELTNFISELFIDCIIFNYYSAIDFLKKNKEKTSSVKLKKIIDSIIKKGEEMYSAYSDLEVFKEFSPSERRLNYYNKLQSKKISKSYEESGGQSSFQNLFKTLHFRTGESSFAKVNGEYSQELTPATISHSTEMPRGEFIDPIGQAKLRLLWQNFTRTK